MAKVKDDATSTTRVAGRKTTKKVNKAAQHLPQPAPRPVRAKGTGAVLDKDAEAALLAEAEAGYDPDALVPRRTPGRPSLSPGGGTSHRINVRVDIEIYEVLQQVARDTGRKPSELVREVLRAAYGPKTS